MRFLKVPKSKGEKTRRELDSKGLLSKEFAIKADGKFIFLPVVGDLPVVDEVRKHYPDFALVELKAEKRLMRCDRIKDALSGVLTKSELESLIASFDILGTIAIIEVPPALEPKERQIGEAILQVHRNVKSVFKKLGPMEGEYRTRKLKLIAGNADSNNTETVYRESGALLKLDASRVYFSVRLAHERKRIAELVKLGEHVLVLFAGVGPFALVIAKISRPTKQKKVQTKVQTTKITKITAVEINPDAVRYMRENIVLNKAKNIEVVEGDARAFSGAGFDRVVMPLPKGAEGFLDVAYRAVRDGGTVHFYTFADSRNPFSEAMKKAKNAASACNVMVEPSSMRIVRPYSPQTVQVVLDLIVQKKIRT